MRSLTQAHQTAKRRRVTVEVEEKRLVLDRIREAVEEAKTVKDLRAALLDVLDILSERS